ncbi:hypothetical protein GCM10007940_25350 [Portibacter lacus]|uniref:Uncharacterized protein n=2 Tax=Portibacter lacus TaxID=1099794 RepID=A0AA37SQB1_9BACT|nr:hypothetical protein GCM10007940_25350 [Portibacter lacus]
MIFNCANNNESFILFSCDDSKDNGECSLITTCIEYVSDSISWLPKEEIYISLELHGISEEDIKFISSIDSSFTTIDPVKIGEEIECTDLGYPIISREEYDSKERKENLFGCSPIFVKGNKAVIFATFENKDFFVPLLVFFQKNNIGEWEGVRILEHGIG